MTLIACPACSCHFRADERVCPHCDVPLRSDRNGAIARATGAVVLGLAALAGCGNEVTIIGAGGNGGSSGNGQQSTTTGKVSTSQGQGPTSNVASTYGVGPSTTGNFSTTGFGCDANPPGGVGSDGCLSCVDCAQTEGQCAAEIDAFANHPNGFAWSDCVFGNGGDVEGCPTNDPNAFEECLAGCDMQYPGAQAVYIPVLDCLGCKACGTSCNGDFGLGDCSTITPQ